MVRHIDICIATYKRPGLLSRLMASLAEQTIRDKVRLRLIIVDNDVGRSANEVVEVFEKNSGMDVVYDVESNQGISYARNRGISHVASPFVAFLDDDEVAPRNWLETMLEVLERYEADAVFGPVIAQLPSSAPAWSRTHPSFSRPRMPTGTLIEHAGSGNVLCRTHILSAQPKLFDERYARSGGSDTEFFGRLHSCGSKLVWCDEAEITEFAPPERLTIRWVCRRAYRGGQTYYRIFVSQRPLYSKIVWLGKRLIALAVLTPLLPLSFMGGGGFFVFQVTRCCGWVGQLSRVFGDRFEYEEYSGGRSGK